MNSAPRNEAGPEYRYDEAIFFISPIALADRRQSPLSPMGTNDPFLLGLRMTRACQLRQWAILSLLPRAAAPLLSGAKAKHTGFSPLAWSQRNLCRSQPLLRPKPADRQQDDAVVMQR